MCILLCINNIYIEIWPEYTVEYMWPGLVLCFSNASYISPIRVVSRV